ncbi:hypothetical protein G9272_01870 [Streptomyces asoensis]|uniref:Uncharacterized protein n=1 Tax=Streptomyces asoensis TaxID=249586 RepID=A0A6M4WMX2_9ACTN|nr:hypothetical protein [Streptomyces asoensis]QJS99215.1 hypothetical protein G9272_01870 [Streptomyces asoensis]
MTKRYGVKYWEIGSEFYGNGLYGATWETDHHASRTATTYATHLVQYATWLRATSSATRQTVPPYSIVVVLLRSAR